MFPRWHDGDSGRGGSGSSDGAHKQEERNLRRQCNSINEGNPTM